jgi:hypothetical protein
MLPTLKILHMKSGGTWQSITRGVHERTYILSFKTALPEQSPYSHEIVCIFCMLATAVCHIISVVVLAHDFIRCLLNGISEGGWKNFQHEFFHIALMILCLCFCRSFFSSRDMSKWMPCIHVLSVANIKASTALQ